MSVQFYYSQKMAMSASETLFDNISATVRDKMVSYDEKIVNVIEYLEELEGISDRPSLDKSHPAERLMYKTINNNRDIYSIYVGHADGSFIQFVNLKLSQLIRDNFNAPEDAHWAIQNDKKTSTRCI
jgi:hypothetical protein